ncbi:PP2C family protein-serine/threonine phosphatase [Streptomyces sp. NPDC002574]|uniref:PP2C family protein-serine/threonine phosphatase n=1 Tax=Streptomyces sp. NPDC002574 TaxID=3364652 RepID=UPI0036D0535B
MAHEQLRLSEVLAAAEAAAPAESVEVIARNLRDRFGARSVSFLVADVIGRRVVRIGDQDVSRQGRGAEQIPLSGTLYERALRGQRLVQEPGAGRDLRVIVPVTNRGDAIGLLELTLPEAAGSVLEQVGEAAHALAFLIVMDRRFTDLYHWLERTTSVSLAAEIQRGLLPSAASYEGERFTLAGALVPADSVGGDTYDYAVDHDTLHLSITDAMGHDVDSALLATLTVNASRGARRAGCDLAEQALRMHRTLLDHGHNGLATGQLLRIAMDGAGTQVINAGHPWPLRLRGGAVEEVRLDVHLPFGVPSRTPFRVQPLDLRAGDRLILYTDGMQERRATAVDLAAVIRETATEHPREVVRAATAAVFEACRGQLQDDATILCLDWRGPRTGERRAH